MIFEYIANTLSDLFGPSRGIPHGVVEDKPTLRDIVSDEDHDINQGLLITKDRPIDEIALDYEIGKHD